MILTLLKRAVKAALHGATEEWLLEVGLPRAAVEEVRARRLALAAEAEDRADERAALALGVEDEPMGPPALPMPAAARLTPHEAEPALPTADGCPAAPASEAALLDWVGRQRQAQVPWADSARAASAAGHGLTEQALRGRYHRRRAQDAQTGEG